MFDAKLRQFIDPSLNAAGRTLAQKGVAADHITLIGLVAGLIAAICIIVEATLLALLPILASRLADGLDGAVARATEKTDFGGYLDIVSDFFFYGAIPFAFVVMNPAENAIAGAFLLLSFYINGASFLGFAVLAEKANMESSAQGEKSLYYSNGILEGGETILFFILICLLPSAFAFLAFVFGTLCFLTAFLRVFAARRIFTYKEYR